MLEKAQLFAKFANTLNGSVTAQDVAQVAAAFGLHIGEDKVQGVIDILKEDSEVNLLTWAGNPQNMGRLRNFLTTPNTAPPPVARCPHCSGLFELHFQR